MGRQQPEKLTKYCLITLSTFFSFSQEKENPIFFNELHFSINRTIIEAENTTDGYGFGVDLYKCFRDTHKLNILVGASFNRTAHDIKYLNESHFSSSSDLTYHFQTVSLPFLVRLKLGKSTKIFIESVPFLELNAGSYRTGTFMLLSN